MRFAQFYHMSTGYAAGSIPPTFDDARKTPIEACGDRAVIIIDQRIKPETAGQIAAQACKERGYVGWQMFEGDSFTRCRAVSGYWPVVQGAADKTAMSASYGY